MMAIDLPRLPGKKPPEKDNPRGYLGNGYQQCQHKPISDTGQHTVGSVPVAQDNIYGGRCCDQRKKKNTHGQKCQVERQTVIQKTAIFEVGDAAFTSSGLQASYAEAVTIKRDITQGTQQPSAFGAGRYRLFARMKETFGLSLHLDQLPGRCRAQRPVKRVKQVGSNTCQTFRTGVQPAGIDI
jgi:hypothetical protein